MKAICTPSLIGVESFRRGRKKPKNGEHVIWIWADSGQITAGDCFNGKARDAARNYSFTQTAPTHWMPWPSNWPGATKRMAA